MNKSNKIKNSTDRSSSCSKATWTWPICSRTASNRKEKTNWITKDNFKISKCNWTKKRIKWKMHQNNKKHCRSKMRTTWKVWIKCSQTIKWWKNGTRFSWIRSSSPILFNNKKWLTRSTPMCAADAVDKEILGSWGIQTKVTSKWTFSWVWIRDHCHLNWKHLKYKKNMKCMLLMKWFSQKHLTAKGKAYPTKRSPKEEIESRDLKPANQRRESNRSKFKMKSWLWNWTITLWLRISNSIWKISLMTLLMMMSKLSQINRISRIRNFWTKNKLQVPDKGLKNNWIIKLTRGLHQRSKRCKRSQDQPQVSEGMIMSKLSHFQTIKIHQKTKQISRSWIPVIRTRFLNRANHMCQFWNLHNTR